MESTPAGLRRLEVPALVRRHAADARRVERVLAAARVALCCACAVTLQIGSTVPSSDPTFVGGILAGYFVESLIVGAAVTLLRRVPRWLPFALHVVDFAFTAVVTLATGGLASPFFVMFLFVILASAFRWRLSETLLTGTAALAVLALQSWLLTAPAFDYGRFLLRGTYVTVAALLLGFVADDEKQRRSEVAAAGELLAAIQSHAGFRPALRHVCGELLEILKADRIVIAAREVDAERVVRWTAVRAGHQHPIVLTSTEVPDEHDMYFFPAAGDGWSIGRRRGNACVLKAVDREARPMDRVTCSVAPAFWERHPYNAALVIPIGFGGDWRGRVFLFRQRRFVLGELRFTHRVLCSLVPAMHSQYLVRRLRSRAGAAERRRVARELHDSVIQSLIGLEFQVAAVRRQLGGREPQIQAQLHAIQHRLVEEARAVRDVMHQIRPLELGPGQLVPAMAEIVDRFSRETGIAAEFHSASQHVRLAPRVARELVRTLQEALMNVRKHAGARHVSVGLGRDRDGWRLSIENDGRPFGFTGRLTLEELEARRLGPRVIKERVREMGATMAIDSSPEGGVRLEISLPVQEREARRG